MTSKWQRGLRPERGDELRSALHGLEPVASKGADFADGLQAQIGQFALLHVAPNVFDGIEFGRVRRQAFENNMSTDCFDEALDHPAAVRRQTIPDDEQLAVDLVGERLQEFHELGTTDRTGVEAEVFAHKTSVWSRKNQVIVNTDFMKEAKSIRRLSRLYATSHIYSR